MYSVPFAIVSIKVDTANMRFLLQGETAITTGLCVAIAVKAIICTPSKTLQISPIRNSASRNVSPLHTCGKLKCLFTKEFTSSSDNVLRPQQML